MKNQGLTVLFCSALAVLASGCSQDLEENVNKAGRSYTATVENTATGTRSYNGGDGVFLWSNGDNISVYSANGFQTMTFKSGAGTGVATYESPTFIPKEVAVFPTTAAKSYTGGELIVNYPATLTQSSDVNDPMVAQFGDDQTTFNFRHVGGVLAFTALLPAGVDGFQVTTDKPISGDFKVNTSGQAPVVATSETTSTDANTVKFSFTKTNASGIYHFYLPVPTGTYNSLKLAVLNGSTVVAEKTNSSANTVDRCAWLNFEVNFGTYTGTIEQMVTGVSAFKELLANTSAEELAKKDITLDLNGESFSTTNEKNIQTLNVSSLTLKNGTIDATALNVKANSITLKDVKVTGAFPKANGNARLSLNTSGKVLIDNVDFTNVTEGYNSIEINLSNNPVSSNIVIKNCKFGSASTNNAISIFGMPEGGVATIENCTFNLNPNSDAVRISNRFNTHTFTVNLKDCAITYTGATTESVMLFQDYTNTDATTKKAFSGLVINCENVTKNGTKITEFGTMATGKDLSSQFAYVYYDHGGVQTDSSHYPTFTFK